MRRPVYDRVLCLSPFSEVAERLNGDPASWLPAPALLDEGGGHIVSMRPAGLPSPLVVAVDALVDVGPATTETIDQGLVVRSVAWRARTIDRAFPRLVGELELTPFGETACQLRLVGGYEPPVSVAGDVADRLIGRHIAEAVVRTFLEDVADHLAALADHRTPSA